MHTDWLAGCGRLAVKKGIANCVSSVTSETQKKRRMISIINHCTKCCTKLYLEVFVCISFMGCIDMVPTKRKKSTHNIFMILLMDMEKKSAWICFMHSLHSTSCSNACNHAPVRNVREDLLFWKINASHAFVSRNECWKNIAPITAIVSTHSHRCTFFCAHFFKT